MTIRPHAHQSCSWSVPVPVAPGGFTALHPAHQALDVCVDLSQIEAFRVPDSSFDPTSVLYADLQLNGEMNVRRRLGSGRAGFYKGKYLKGVGRTPLAANWAESADTYHATGHMFPSSAVRERIATVFMQARGAADLIVECEGLLLRRMPGDLARGVASFERSCDGPFPACDRTLQAISVKPGDFARLSNILWLLSFVRPSAPAIADFGYRLAMYAQPPSAAVPLASALSPSAVISHLREAIDRGVWNFLRHFELGIYWGSYFNNFTLDGRFLDLEVPLIHGTPFVGKLCDHTTPTLSKRPEESDGTLLGIELFDFVYHVRAALVALDSMLQWKRRVARDAKVAEFLEGLLDALRSELGATHVLHDRDVLCDRVSQVLIACGGAPSAIRAAVEHEFDVVFHGEVADGPELGLARLPDLFAPPEPTRWSTAFVATGLLAEPQRGLHSLGADAKLVNELLRELDEITDVDALLEATHEAEAVLRREISPSMPSSLAEGA
ncbi:MAG: hypothetical protein ACE37F_13670 [Nannocystaceae bacterium]|nr:hypothetical protein [bacterium]